MCNHLLLLGTAALDRPLRLRDDLLLPLDFHAQFRDMQLRQQVSRDHRVADIKVDSAEVTIDAGGDVDLLESLQCEGNANMPLHQLLFRRGQLHAGLCRFGTRGSAAWHRRCRLLAARQHDECGDQQEQDYQPWGIHGSLSSVGSWSGGEGDSPAEFTVSSAGRFWSRLSIR